ncbi:MAG: Rv0909 family putative TA system antitoxin [Solirubrobacteraceae bacterium]|jgi:hypothetical protein
MGFADRLKDLGAKAEEAAAEHKDQVHKAVLKAEELADRQTGGQYHDEIAKAGTKADAFVDTLQAPDAPAAKGDGSPDAAA